MPEIKRRLTAVAFADVAGWSHLVEQDDAQALATWKHLRASVIEPRIGEHGGRLIDDAGDGLFVEFPSAVAAVQWAMTTQAAIASPASDAKNLRLRIGVNVAEVIDDGGKLVGDGVNIAARIHQMCGPGEVVVTEAVREQVGHKIRGEFSNLGEQQLKNIGHLVRVFRVDAPGTQAAGIADEPRRAVRALLAVDLPETQQLLEQDEADAVARWRRLMDHITRDVLPARDGRVVRHLEEGLLMDFPRAQPAVNAAFAIQRACSEANEGVAAERRMLPRMGVQVSELITNGGDVYGRGVHLATGLTSLAGPGEIVVSAEVRDQLTPTLDADVEDLGECHLHQLAQPVRAYRVGPPGPEPVVDPGSAELRPTLAVIPFSARTTDDDVIGEVLADEVISALSRSADVNVISRLSTTAFRGREASIHEVNTHLHADYALSGAYRVASGQITLSAELAETRSGRVVWAKELKGRVASIIEGKDEIIDRLVTEASAALIARELERTQFQMLPTLESYTLLMGGITLMHRLSTHDFDRSRRMLETLVERAPRLAIPRAWLGKWHVLRVWQGWSPEPVADTQRALECTRRALEADGQCSLALAVDGMVHANLLKRLDVAEDRYQLALRVNPNDSLAWLLLGTLHAFKGEGKEALRGTQRAIRLSPLDPLRYFYDALAGTAALAAHQYERAVRLAQSSLRANCTHASTFRVLAIAQWQLGRVEDARKTVSQLMRLEPTLTIRKYRERSPSSGYETGEIWANALRNAGVPE